MIGDGLALAALVRKRGELAGELRTLETRADQLRSDLLHMDAAIRLVEPGFVVEAIAPKAKRRTGWFGHGELVRLVLESLRRAAGPLTAREVALAVMGRKGFDADDAPTVRLVEKRVDATLRRRGGMVEKVVYGPRNIGWQVRA